MRTNFVERTGKIEELDRAFDLKFWQAQTDVAAWELVVHSYIIKGKDVNKLLLQRTIEHLQRSSS